MEQRPAKRIKSHHELYSFEHPVNYPSHEEVMLEQKRYLGYQSSECNMFLPYELVMHICEFLEIKDLNYLSLTCKYWDYAVYQVYRNHVRNKWLCRGLIWKITGEETARIQRRKKEEQEMLQEYEKRIGLENWRKQWRIVELKNALKTKGYTGRLSYSKSKLQEIFTSMLLLECYAKMPRKKTPTPPPLPSYPNPLLEKLPKASVSFPRLKKDAMIRIVDKDYYPTLNHAVQASQHGDIIVLSKGVHVIEPLIIEKDLEILGNGDRGDIILIGPGSKKLDYLIQIKDSNVRFYSLTLILRKNCYTREGIITVENSNLEIDYCDIQCSESGIFLGKISTAMIKNSLIHDSKIFAIMIHHEAIEAILENNQIYNNGMGEGRWARGHSDNFETEEQRGYYCAIEINISEIRQGTFSNVRVKMRKNKIFNNFGHGFGIRTRKMIQCPWYSNEKEVEREYLKVKNQILSIDNQIFNNAKCTQHCPQKTACQIKEFREMTLAELIWYKNRDDFLSFAINQR